mmetsp:Transcript_7436/g.13962  ORF Transcript_7436/g.13962 Transcript_7436/m.13962 type:complete len:241 (+) Transcript_7436:235-957(+)
MVLSNWYTGRWVRWFTWRVMGCRVVTPPRSSAVHPLVCRGLAMSTPVLVTTGVSNWRVVSGPTNTSSTHTVALPTAYTPSFKADKWSALKGEPSTHRSSSTRIEYRRLFQSKNTSNLYQRCSCANGLNTGNPPNPFLDPKPSPGVESCMAPLAVRRSALPEGFTLSGALGCRSSSGVTKKSVPWRMSLPTDKPTSTRGTLSSHAFAKSCRRSHSPPPPPPSAPPVVLAVWFVVSAEKKSE